MVRLSSILLLVLLLTVCGTAQWSTDPYNNLIVGYGLNPELASDGAGGCYITYEQNTAYPRRLILERLDRYGYKPWGGGKRILGLLPEQSFAKITEDGNNGVIVSYQDIEITGDPHNPQITEFLRVQRVDSSGNFLWDSAGVRVTLSNTDQSNQAIVSDGSGGCIVAWVDTLGDLRINRINSEGVRMWGDSGKYVWNSPKAPPMVSDANGGCYIVYGIGRLQRFRSDGTTYWPPQGVLISTGPWIIHLDQSNIYFFGSRYIGYNGQTIFSIHLQKVDSSGSLLWDSLGVTLDTLNTDLSLNYDFSAQSGYSTIAWTQDTSGVWDLRTQIVRSDGSTVFEYRGISISRVSSQKGIVGVLPSDSMTSLYVWVDGRTPLGVYIQRLDTLGRPLWDSLDVLLCDISLGGGLKITRDGNGGCIVVGWRESDFTVRSQQISKYGNLGEIITLLDDNIVARTPQEFKLYQNYPNPFNSSTIIQYEIPKSNWVRLDVYNLLGQKLRTLIDQFKQPGVYHITFEASDLASGIYVYKLQTTQTIQTKKFTILK
jgi:hypothetical protein